MSIPSIDILIAEPDADYALIDSGNGKKLEQFGKHTCPPEPEAFWKPALPLKEWGSVPEYISGSSENQGQWKINHSIPDKCQINTDLIMSIDRPPPCRYFPRTSAPMGFHSRENLNSIVSQLSLIRCGIMSLWAVSRM